MRRQDEFLRRLLELAKEGEFLDVIELIEERLPLLKPVAYENYDLSTGLSGGGIHHICGDKASIARVQLALHNEESFRPYVVLHRELQDRMARIQAIVTL